MPRRACALLALACGRLAHADDAWKLLRAYPPHYVALKLAPGEALAIDGRLNDSAWAAVPWISDEPGGAGGFVDITAHADAFLNAVPALMQTRVKVRWDDDFFYVGAELEEPFVYADAAYVGNNDKAPYGDAVGDFEVFIDVAGTTEYYMEFEMGLLNCTYDIKWGKPDGVPLACGTGDAAVAPAYCVNTSFHGYAGNWTMVARAPPPAGGGDAGGLRAATHFEPADFGRFVWGEQRPGGAGWSLEVAFPIRATANYSTEALGPSAHGGLLDADPSRQALYDAFDPARGGAGPGRPRYWWVDFARAEHPQLYNKSDGAQAVCPFNCTADLADATWAGRALPSRGDAAHAQWPTLLGGGYWEWVWGPVGDANPGVGYMHRPSTWPLVQFADAADGAGRAALCRNIEFPGRHVALSLHLAQAAYAQAHNGTFASAPAALASADYCSPALGTSDTCDLAALELALARADVFAIALNVTLNATALSAQCTARPCYTAAVAVAVPAPSAAGAPYRYVATINENRLVLVDHPDPTATAPCL